MPHELDIELANARVSITRTPGLAQAREFRLRGYRVLLLGRPGWLVDYERLEYQGDPQGIARSLEQGLGEWLGDQGRLYLLARLSGMFMILVCRGDRLERLVTSDDFPNTVYHRRQQGRLLVSDDPWPLIRRRALDLESYSPRDLAYYDRRKTCRPGRTLFPGLSRFQPATLYSVEDHYLQPRQAVYYIKQDSRSLGHADFLAVVGKRMPPGRYTLAYSTGIDSHHLLKSFPDWIDDVCTVFYPGPYQDKERTKEAAAAVVNTVEAAKELRLVRADFRDLDNLEYLRHGVWRDPFACHHSFSVYNMFKTAGQRRLMTGQNADTVQWFGLTSPLPWWRLPLPSPLKNYTWEWQRAWYRLAVARSYGRLVQAEILDRRLFYGCLELVRPRVGPHGYWHFTWFKMINNMTSGNTAIFRNAAAFFGKEVYFPYIEPLALYVSSYYRRPLTSMFEPKRALRRRYRYLRHSHINYPVAPGRPPEESPLFRAVAQRMQEAAPELKQALDARARGYMTRLFLYQIVIQSLEGNA